MKFTKTNNLLILSVFVLIFKNFCPIFAQTEVGGIITENTIWIFENSPYTITSTIQIPSGVSLTIEQSVNVNMPSSGDMFLIHGTLYAHGTDDKMIVFDGGYNSNFFSAKSSGPDAFLSLDYCIIQNGRSFWPPTGFEQYGYFSLKHSELINLTYYSEIWYPEKDVHIEYNKFMNTGGFLTVHNGNVKVYIQYNLFDRKNSNLPSYANYWVQNCGSNDSSETIVKYNSFLNVEGIALILPSGYSGASMSATHNYWYTQNTDSIDAMIYDKNDDITCASYINYLPILTEPHPDTPLPDPHTWVSGNITENTTWTKANSPYIVTGDVQVLQNTKLTIEPGVNVIFNSGTSLNIDGELIAIGTESDSIIFDGMEEIYFAGNSADYQLDPHGNYLSGSTIQFARFKNGTNGISIRYSSPFISNNTIDNQSFYGIKMHYSSAIVKNNLIYDCYEGIWFAEYDHSVPKEFSIVGNIIKSNVNCGIKGRLRTSGFISYNVITKNGIGIEITGTYTTPTIIYNNIFNNFEYNFSLGTNYSDVKADFNYWGTTNIENVSSLIYDYYDDINNSKVIFHPHLTTATPINISSIELKTDNTYSTNLTATLSILDTLYIELTGTDGDETNQDTTAACVINESKTDSISVKLIETSLNTGVYRGIAYYSTETYDDLDIIGVEKGDNIKIISSADNSIYKEFLSIVPVELCLFNANIENNSTVILNWKTLSETNNYGFEIQKSIDRIKFEKIGFIIGNGTTSEDKNYMFTDKNVNTGTYYYRLKQIDFDGSYEYSDVIKIEINSPKEFSLHQNYPNPFNPETAIKYQLPEESLITLKIYNIYGQEIKTLVNYIQNPGIYEIIWDGTNEQGIAVTSGIYFYELKTEDFIKVKKMLLIK